MFMVPYINPANQAPGVQTDRTQVSYLYTERAI